MLRTCKGPRIQEIGEFAPLLSHQLLYGGASFSFGHDCLRVGCGLWRVYAPSS